MTKLTFSDFQTPVFEQGCDGRDGDFEAPYYRVTAFCQQEGMDLIVAEFKWDGQNSNSAHWKAQAKIMADLFVKHMNTQ